MHHDIILQKKIVNKLNGSVVVSSMLTPHFTVAKLVNLKLDKV